MVNFSQFRHSQSRVKPVEDRRTLGMMLIVLAVLLFTGLDSSAKYLAINGMPPVEIVFMRYLVHLVLVMAVLFPLQGPSLMVTRRPGLEVIRALALLASTALNFFAVRYLPLTTTSSILFSMPLILCALSVPMLGERVGPRRWVAVFVGLAGVLIIIQPGGAAFHPAMILSVGAAFTLAFYNIMNRKLAGVDSPNTQQFYAGLVATLCVAPFAFTDWVWPQGAVAWTAFLAMGFFGGVGHLLVTTAARMAEASALAPFNYVQIVFMTASSWLIFGQPPDIWIYAGVPIVIGSGLYIWLREHALERRQRRAVPMADV